MKSITFMGMKNTAGRPRMIHFYGACSLDSWQDGRLKFYSNGMMDRNHQNHFALIAMVGF
ncbi:hypothetical protein IP68_03630 [Blastomonas sp. AAP25]|nr:hypothetical protein IP68_03630 [Blastomonas sp. AAP25]